MLGLNSYNCWTAHVFICPPSRRTEEPSSSCKLPFKIRGNLFASPGDNLLDAIAAFSQGSNKVGLGSRDFLDCQGVISPELLHHFFCLPFPLLFFLSPTMTPTSGEIRIHGYLAQQMQIRFMSATATALNVDTCNICTVQTNKQLKLIYEHKTKCIALWMLHR